MSINEIPIKCQTSEPYWQQLLVALLPRKAKNILPPDTISSERDVKNVVKSF